MLDYLESRTFDVILTEMLDTVPNDVDKLEGSIIYDALAPTALKLAETYWDMAVLYRRTFAATSDGIDLEKRVNEHGVERKKAGKSIRRALFTDGDGLPLDVEIHSQYRLDALVYKVIERIEAGEYKVEVQTAGTVGNKDYGEMLPIEANNKLGKAVLADVLIPGEDDETDESLYLKYLDHIRNIAFGGNRTDYRRKIMQIKGVGGVRLYRAPWGGGTVKAVIVDAEFNEATTELIELVQETVDPIEFKGDGYGTAPIGHGVTIETAGRFSIDFETTLILSEVTLRRLNSKLTKLLRIILMN